MIKKIAYSGAAAIVFICCVLAFFNIFLPNLLNSDTLRREVSSRIQQPVSWQVRRAGLNGADISNIRIGRENESILAVRSVSLDYSLPSLLTHSAERIAVSGITIACGMTEGRFYIRLPLPEASSSSKDKKPLFPLPALPFQLLEIRDAKIVFNWDGRKFRIPFELDLTSGEGTPQTVRGSVRFRLRGQALTLTALLDQEIRRLSLQLSGTSLKTAVFNDLADMISGLTISGLMDLDIKTEIRLDDFTPGPSRADLVLRNSWIRFGGTKWQGQRTAEDPSAEIHLQVKGDLGQGWDAALSPVETGAPLPVSIGPLACRLKRSEEGFEGSGTVSFTVRENKSAVFSGFTVSSPMTLEVPFSGSVSHDGNWHFSAASSADQVNPSPIWRVKKDDMKISCRKPTFRIRGKGGKGTMAGDFDLSVPGIHFSGPQKERAETAALTVKGNVLKNEKLKISIEAAASGISAERDKAALRIPVLSLTGNKEADQPFQGMFSLKKADLRDNASKSRLRRLDVSLPFEWPWGKRKKTGKISLGEIRVSGQRLGSMSGSLQTAAGGVRFNTVYRSQLIKGFSAKIFGKSDFMLPEMESSVTVKARHKIRSPLDLGKYQKSLAGISATGRLNLDAGILSRSGKIQGHANVTLKDAALRSPDKGLVIEGINTSFSLPELPVVRSAPAQVFSIDSLAFGAIRLEKMALQLQMESLKTVFIEKGQFNWCGGQVNLQPLRIQPGVDDYDAVLYCDRIHLAQVLDQLGVAQAEGKGAVNGKIPISFKKGQLKFDNGFLYSTPGDGGTIHVSKADLLTAGIPKNTSQYFQIDLAREALKSYEYEWAKLRLNSEGENLMLNLKFDGKPSKPLPFVYKHEFGGFIRVEGKNPGSNFQGIRLDVNMGLPLNQILQYKELWKKIQ